MSDEDAIIMLSEAFDLINLNKDNSQSINDYKEIIKSIGDTVACRYDIPLDIFYGTKTEKSMATNDFITFSVDPYFEIIEDGYNMTLIGKEDYLKGEMVRHNKSRIQHKDILDSATGIDKLRGSGFSRNETNDFMGLPRIDAEWADEHYITKNYGKVEGGEENG
ncbi:MAG: phage portal protein [Clostridia bacterium]|nr:phage portal protein [Clostridia bacterium]